MSQTMATTSSPQSRVGIELGFVGWTFGRTEDRRWNAVKARWRKPLTSVRTRQAPLVCSISGQNGSAGEGNNDAAEKEEVTGAFGGTEREGLFIRILLVRFRREVTEKDAMALLCEYGRGSLAEEGVARLDILREPMAPNPKEFLILQVFRSAKAMLDHEVTAHASKLRTLIVGNADDSGLELYKKALEVTTLRPLYPPTNGWISNLEGKLSSTEVQKSSLKTQSIRDSLELLIENVGLEDVTVYFGAARAKDEESAPNLARAAVSHARDSVRKGNCIRTAVMIDPKDTNQISVLEAYPLGSDFALFDLSLADEYLDSSGWKVRKYVNVFPDCVGWVMPDDLAGSLKNEEPLQLEPTQTIHSKTKIIFGARCFESVGEKIKEMGRRVFLVTGFNQARADPLLWEIDSFVQNQELEVVSSHCVPDSPPDLSTIMEGVDRARRVGADVVVGYGGGSALDAAKAIASALNEPDDGWKNQIMDSFENSDAFCLVDLNFDSKPLVLIPSRPGAGAEVADRSMISLDRGNRIVCVDFQRGNETKLRLAMIDPRLAAEKRVSWKLAARGGLVSLATCIETCLGKSRSPISIALAKEGIARAAPAVRGTIDAPQDVMPRNDLVASSMLSGLARENAGFGLSMALCLALGWGDLTGPDEELLSFDLLFLGIFPHALEVVTPLLNPLDRKELNVISSLVTGGRRAGPSDLQLWLRETSVSLDLPNLGDFPMTEKRLRRAASDARSYCQNAAFEPTEQLCLDILNRAFSRSHQL